MSNTPLAESRAIELVAGRGQVALGPERAGERWEITLITTNGNSAANPLLTVYRNSVSESTIVDSTRAGNRDISGTHLILLTGEKLVAEWAGGTSGARMVLRIEGQIISSR